MGSGLYPKEPMSNPVPRHSVHSHRRGSYLAVCSYCGSEWPRSSLVREPGGLFRCPDEGAGKDSTTLGEEIARCAQKPSPERRPMDAPPVRDAPIEPPAETLEAALTRVYGR